MTKILDLRVKYLKVYKSIQIDCKTNDPVVKAQECKFAATN